MENSEKTNANLGILIFLIPVLGVIYFFISLITYIDPVNMCQISIENDIIRGNKKTIFEAIKLLKREDIVSYKILCGNIDTISENRCMASEPRVDSTRKGWEEDACYIRGSKVIYLKPEEGDGEAIIRKRKEMLKKYSLDSKIFWDSVDR